MNIMVQSTAHNHENEYRNLDSLLKSGGKAVIIGGRHKNWLSYRQHPQLEFWSGDENSDVMRSIRAHNNTLPANTHVVLISKFIPHEASTVIVRAARVRGIKIFANRTEGQIDELLDMLTLSLDPQPAAPKEPTVTTAPPALSKPKRGVLMALVQRLDDGTGTAADMGRLIFTEATRQGILTTQSSVEQAVGVNRRRAGVRVRKPSSDARSLPAATVQSTAVERMPQSQPEEIAVPPTPVPHDMLNLFDEAITNLKNAVAGLELARERVVESARENLQVRDRLNAIQRLLGGGK